MRTVLLLVCALLTACSAGSSSQAEPENRHAAAAALWAEAGPASYRYDFQQECFCVREQVQPVTIEVRNGQIARVISRDSGQELAADPNLRWHTIDGLFQVIAEAEANGTEPLVVEYDPELGYPARIEIGSLAADAGINYTASNLEPL